ncbi:Solute carrier family 22 member 3 [Trachymyrmex zeteki]|uniref:Solute carrier family 22 member 3 n=1 Tax=Mycetomoellerius zeteki TaxID=64791 RepID=A0A151WMS9_9HYME|nr:PREDICTED: organic cation transporter protein-like [Trachymyrmex zeteki]KYQ49143.1 Solute carrier family 22 member 3 [Trachymyrmex zeteki]
MNAEEAKVGCFQMVLVLLLGINYVIVAMSHALPVFHNYTPKFYCQMKDSTNKSYGCQLMENSSMFANFTFASPEVFTSCSGEYHFETEFMENSVVTEWGLVCEKRYLSSLGPTVYYIGVLLGAWITGFLIDRIGRLPVQAICLYMQGTMAVALYIVQSYPAFLVLRSLQGVFVQGLQNSTYILSLELFPARSRTLVALIMQIFWSIGLVLLAILSYVIPDWRILQLAVSVPTAITVLYIWIIPESPRWLLAKEKSTEADMALERIAIYNSCCIRLRTKNILMHEACVKSNSMPIKPKRKSRVISIEFEETRADENQQEEITNLLNKSELTEQKIIGKTLEANSINLKNKFFNVELCRETPSSAENFNKQHLPSNSKCDRESKMITPSKYDQKISPKNTEEVILCKIKKDKTSKNEEKTGSNVTKQAANKISSTLKNAIESSILRKYGAIMICQWWTSTIACNILDDLAPSFPINRHIMFALSAALEMATNTFVYFVLSRYGRRLPICTYQFLNGIVCILIAAFFILTTAIAPWIDIAKTTMLLFGKVTVTSTLSIVYLYTVEIFPTVIRGRCLGLCVMSAEIGSLTILHLLLLRHVSLPMPLLIVGMLCLVSGVLVLILPETLNKILPDQVMDMENIIDENNCKSDDINTESDVKEEDLTERQILRQKLFSENWVDAGNGILVNFTENKNTE